MAWTPGIVHRSLVTGIEAQDGYIYSGLGLILERAAVPARGKRRGKPAQWWLIHLGSGHAVARLTGDVRTVFPAAADIAECGPWADFDTLTGWQQVCPDLPQRTRAAVARWRGVAAFSAGGGSNADSAREVAYARA